MLELVEQIRIKVGEKLLLYACLNISFSGIESFDFSIQFASYSTCSWNAVGSRFSSHFPRQHSGKL